MNKLSQVEQVELDRYCDQFQMNIDRMANRAVARAFAKLKVRFPKRTFCALFGNGDAIYKVDDKIIRIYWNPSSESVVWEPGTSRGAIIPASWSVEIGGARVPPELFAELCILEDELMHITDGFSRGCPDAVGDWNRTEWTVPAGVTP